MTVFVLANAGLPLISVHLPWAVFLFIPIVCIEALVIGRFLGIPLRSAMLPTTVANAISTIVGIPVTWFVLVGVEMVTVGASGHGLDTAYGRFYSSVLQAPWLLPHEDDFYWMVPIATLALLPFYFLVSALIEKLVLLRAFPSQVRRRVSAAAWLANVATYATLLVVTAAWLWSSLQRN